MKNQNLIFTILFIAASTMSAGCAVVKGAPDATVNAYKNLGQWKTEAVNQTAKPDYEKTRRAVNAWIEAKAKEIELAAPQWFAQVDLTRPANLSKDVDTLFGPAPKGIYTDILQVLMEEYQRGRIAEGAATSAGLRDYLWPEKK